MLVAKRNGFPAVKPSLVCDQHIQNRLRYIPNFPDCRREYLHLHLASEFHPTLLKRAPEQH